MLHYFFHNLILPKYLKRYNRGSKFVVCAWAGGANTTPLFLAAHFASQNTKFGGGDPRSRTLRVRYGARSEGGAGIHFPPTPFFARPARADWFLPRLRRCIIRDFVQKRFERRSVIATRINKMEFRPSGDHP
jgi:hypothetical protein